MSCCSTIDLLPCCLDIVLYQGDSWDMHAVIKDSEDVAIDLTGAVIRVQVRKKHGDPVLFEISSALEITIGGLGNNELTWIEIVDLPQGVYKWDLQITFPDGKVRTIFAGKFTTQSDITNNE